MKRRESDAVAAPHLEVVMQTAQFWKLVAHIIDNNSSICRISKQVPERLSLVSSAIDLQCAFSRGIGTAKRKLRIVKYEYCFINSVKDRMQQRKGVKKFGFNRKLTS